MQAKLDRALLGVDGRISSFRDELRQSESKMFEGMRKIESLRIEIESA